LFDVTLAHSLTQTDWLLGEPATREQMG